MPSAASSTGGGSSARFSAEGLTGNGAAYTGAPAKTEKAPAKPKKKKYYQADTGEAREHGDRRERLPDVYQRAGQRQELCPGRASHENAQRHRDYSARRRGDQDQPQM